MRKSVPVSKSLLIWILLGVSFLPGLLGLFHSGFFVSDDGNWMIIRFSAFYEALRYGQFPVRFLPRLLNGYGYPVSDFLYPLFMYLGVPIHIIGMNFVNTIKVLFGLSFIFSGIFSFLWLRRLFTMSGAFVGALAYTYFPYHLFDMYKRGSMGEMLALCIVSFILWQIERKQMIWVSLGIGLLILAHNSLAILFLPILLVYYFLREKKFLHVLLSLVFGLGLTTFFWIPALFDKQYTVFDSKVVSVSSQYFLVPSTYYLIGIVCFAGAFALSYGIKKKNVQMIFWGIVFFLSIFLTLPISNILWNVLPLNKYVQFPFRFLSLTALAVSFLIAYGISFCKQTYKNILLAGAILVIVFSALPVLIPVRYQTFPDSWYSTNQDSTTVQNEYLPLWVNAIPSNKTQITQVIQGEGKITNQTQNGSHIRLQAEITKPAILQINTIYFPGWEVQVDNRKTDIVYANVHGLIEIALPVGSHTISAKFVETPVRLVADFLSLMTLLSLSVFALVHYKKK